MLMLVNKSYTLMNNIWEIFPAIFCINLVSRPDRHVSAVKTMCEMGIDPTKVIWHRPVKDPRGGRFGCAESHMFCIRKAYEMKVPYALIFEDDIIPQQNWQQPVKEVKEFLDRKEPFDVLRLFANINIPLEQVYKNIWRAGTGSNAAYVISRPFMAKLLLLRYDGVHADCLQALAAERELVINTNVFSISGSTSDNEWSVKTQNQSIVTKAMNGFMGFIQKFSGKAMADVTNGSLSLLKFTPYSIRYFVYRRWLRSLIPLNDIPPELTKQLNLDKL